MIPCGDLFFGGGVTYRAEKNSLSCRGTGRAGRAYLGVRMRCGLGSYSFRFAALGTGVVHETVFGTGRLLGYRALVPLVAAFAARAKCNDKQSESDNQNKNTDFLHF